MNDPFTAAVILIGFNIAIWTLCSTALALNGIDPSWPIKPAPVCQVSAATHNGDGNK